MQLKDIQKVRSHFPSWIRRTPILPFSSDSSDVGKEKLFLKAENLQVTGAYKIRAAVSILNSLSSVQLSKGVVLTSSGNFAQAFAYAGSCMGVKIVVVMLNRASSYKIEATRGYGAEVVFCGEDALSRQPMVEKIAKDRGMTAINTWEEPMATVGHGTIGLEILEDMEAVQLVLVPVSSGGVAAGISSAIKQTNPKIKVIGVQPEQANAAFVSLQKGEPTLIDYWDTIADGLSAVCPGLFPFRHLQKYLDEIVLVSEVEIANAFSEILYRCKILAEPAGAVASAAFLSGKVTTDLITVATVTGGNVTNEMVTKMKQMID
ncbi:MAG: threonine/serine dehydratase [Nitrospinota bacterium]|nr:threonine/serine dehydratase [Nitrospinota bacterium]